MLVASTTIGKDQTVKLVAILDQIQRLAESERATQETIDELAEVIKALPSESRTAFMGFLTSLAAGPWVAALLKLVQGLGGVAS
jgi:Mg2+ and Co2+ transporter CorA